MSKMLTSYRVIPAMYRALQEEGYFTDNEEIKELARLLGVLPRNVLPIIKPYKAQIIYAMQDFRHYVDLIGDIPTFEEAYWPAMNEEATLIKNYAPFVTNAAEPKILDIGAGSAPYIEAFYSHNSWPLTYIAVDKREFYGSLLSSSNLIVRNITADIFDWGRNEFDERGINSNILFLGNFLHCVEDIDAFFSRILPCLPNLKLIKILEIKPDCNLDFLFDYHMAQHCGGQRVTAETIENSLNKPVEIDTLGDYHNMYTVEL